jgi:hypothetical protein
MPISEGLFHQSSEMVINILQAIGTDRQKVISIALDTMVLTALGLGVDREELAKFFSRYARYWSSFLDKPLQTAVQVEQAFIRQQAYLMMRIETLKAFLVSNEDHLFYREWVDLLRAPLDSYREIGAYGKLVSPYDMSAQDEPTRIKLAIQSIAFSMIHMTNNRLGITPIQEYYLGRLIELAANAAEGK